MDKTERSELFDKGISVLRPMFDQRRLSYKIMKYTYSGGWARFGTGWYMSEAEAYEKIDMIVANQPDAYAKEGQS